MVIYNLQKRSWKVAKTGQHGGKQHAPKQRADQENNRRDTPLSGKVAERKVTEYSNWVDITVKVYMKDL